MEKLIPKVTKSEWRQLITPDRVKISLAVALIASLVVPFLDELAENSLVIFAVGAALLAALAFTWQKNEFDGIMLLVIAITFGAVHFRAEVLDDVTLSVRTMAILAFTGLSLTLMIGPSAYLAPKLNWLVKHRRHLGVTSMLIGLTHANLVIIQYFDWSISDTYALTFPIFGSITLTIMFFMGVTSWDWAQKHISQKLFTALHAFIFILVAGDVVFAGLEHPDNFEAWHIVSFIIFALIWLAVSPWSLPRFFQKHVSGWKQVHVLVFIAYASIVIHVVESGLLEVHPEWASIVFWATVAVVALLHTAKWIQMALDAKEGNKSKVAAESSEANQSPTTQEIDGKTFYRLGAAEDFQEGIGQRFVLNGQAVAAFLHEGRIIAMSATCAHQGGPLDQGKIINGFVTCPWHGWEFGVEDGCAPKPYTDCVPYYEAIQKDNAWWAHIPSAEEQATTREWEQ